MEISARRPDAGEGDVSFSVPGAPAAPRDARHTLAAWLDPVVEPAVVEVAVLLVSELVANCVRHAGASDGRAIAVDAALLPATVRVEVSCSGPPFEHHPRRPRSGDAPHGLYYVEVLSERWQIDRGPPPRVSFEVSRDPDRVAERWTSPNH